MYGSPGHTVISIFSIAYIFFVMSQAQTNSNKLNKFYKYFIAAVKGEETSLTSGSINKAIFMLAVPMILEMGMESIFAVVDIFYVSRLGTAAAATVGLTESILAIIYAIAVGLSMATTAMVARRIGEKRPAEAAEAAVQSMIIAVGIGVLIGLGGIIFAADILRLMGGSEQLVREGFTFTLIMLGGNVIIILLFLNNAIFRGAGNASIAMRSLIIANCLNIALGPIFIFVLGLGVKGAAIATTIGRGTGVLYQFYVLFGKTSVIKITRKDFNMNMHLMYKIFKIALGGMGQFLIGSASWIFLVRIISEFGDDAVAGYTYAFRVIVFTILPSWGLANAAATMVGQNLGAGHPERAERSVWKAAFYNMVFLGVVSVIFFLLAGDIISLFSKEGAAHTYGTLGLKYICLGYVFFAYGMVITQSFNGAGDTKTPTLINVFCNWIVEIPLAYLLAVTLGMGPSGVYIGMVISFTLTAIISILIFRAGRWKAVRV